MSNEDINRLKDDLSTMRQALKLDKPYDAKDIPSALLVGAGALVALPLIEFTTWNRQLILILALLPGAWAYLCRYLEVRKAPLERTELRKEFKIAAYAVVTVIPGAFGFLRWHEWNGISTEAAGSAIFFCMGMVWLGIGLLDASRRSYLIGSVFVTAYAVLLPVLTPQRIATVGVGILASVCFLTAAFLWWQTRLDAGSSDRSESAV